MTLFLSDPLNCPLAENHPDRYAHRIGIFQGKVKAKGGVLLRFENVREVSPKKPAFPFASDWLAVAAGGRDSGGICCR